jgi:hypothetical protein
LEPLIFATKNLHGLLLQSLNWNSIVWAILDSPPQACSPVSKRSSHRAVEAVAEVAEAGDDVFLVVETFVD